MWFASFYYDLGGNMTVDYLGVYGVCLKDNGVLSIKKQEDLIRIDMTYQEAVKKLVRDLRKL